VKIRNYWNLQSLVGEFQGRRHFLQSSNPDCFYIIRLGFNGACSIYDTRANQPTTMTTDFDFFGYRAVSHWLSQDDAKRAVRKLLKGGSK